METSLLTGRSDAAIAPALGVPAPGAFAHHSTIVAGDPDAFVPTATSSERRLWWLSTAGILAAGIALRLVTWRAFNQAGFDEHLYAHYLDQLIHVGLGRYPDIVDAYLALQKTLEGSILPPTRFLYIFFAYLWHGVFGGAPLGCFYAVSRVFSVGVLLVAAGFIRRLLPDRRMALAVLALMAFSPLQIHFAQHALVDGFFEFWALLTLWALWENLRGPGRPGWLAVYTVGLALMVTTKENAFFIFVAVVSLLALNRWLRFGTVTRPLLVLTIVGPLVGVAILTNLAGGIGTLVSVYRLGVEKNMHLAYAIATGDGPWYRYLSDFMLVSPLVLILAIGAVFQVRRTERALCFLLVFSIASYLLMCNIKYGMNLRYGTIWDLPLRVFAAAQLGLLAQRLEATWHGRFFAVGVALLCAFDLNQYYRLAVAYPLYELVPGDLLQALHILKG